MTGATIITVSLVGGVKILLRVPDKHPVIGGLEVEYCVRQFGNELTQNWRKWRNFDLSAVDFGGVRQMGGPPFRGGPLPQLTQPPAQCANSPSAQLGELAQPAAPEGTPEISPADIGGDLAAARSALAAKAQELARLDAELVPARDAEMRIRDRIVRTHHRDANGLITLNLDRRGERAGMFAELDAITAQWGSRRSERARLGAHVKSLERLVSHLEQQRARETKRKQKRSA